MLPAEYTPTGDTLTQVVTLIGIVIYGGRKIGAVIRRVYEIAVKLAPALTEIGPTLEAIRAEVHEGNAAAERIAASLTAFRAKTEAEVSNLQMRVGALELTVGGAPEANTGAYPRVSPKE